MGWWGVRWVEVGSGCRGELASCLYGRSSKGDECWRVTLMTGGGTCTALRALNFYIIDA